MSKSKFAEGFNDWLIKFFREIIKMYPQNADFKAVKAQLMTIAATPQYELPIQYFEKYLSPFRTHLRERNEKFFLEFDLSNTGIEYLNYVKDLWKIADDNTKETMWKYFTIFDKLSEKYNSS
jgi:hypothetical protein